MKSIVTEKKCTKCKSTKPVNEFYQLKHTRDGFQDWCKTCVIERSKLNHKPYSTESYQKEKKRYQDYYQKNKERLASYARALWQSNKEAVNKVRNERRRLFGDPSKTARRARKAGNGGRHTNKEWKEVLQRFGNKCLRCGATERITKDHILPIAEGGTDDIDNIQPLCVSCNSSKGTKRIDYRT